jgi:molecular chaperone DnaK (HSP70)
MSAIAIDFGTSNTLVCTSDPLTQTPRTLRFDSISRQFETVTGKSVTAVPTLVYVATDGLVLGEQVRSQRFGFVQPERYFHAFKRDLVADFQAPPRLLDGQTCTPQWIAEQFLRQIWQQVQQQLQPTQVILTVPVGAFERYLDWFQEVAEKLAFPNVRFVDEATAAALGYGIQHPDALVLVIDFGGGTLDLSLVRTVTANSAQTIKAEVLAKADAYVGGVDIDTWLVEHYLQQAGLSRQKVGEVGWHNLLEIAERLKIRLSRELEARESWFDDENFVAHELHVTRSQLDDILEYRQLLEQVRRALDEVLLIALNKGISKADITQVLLVGGSCYIPAVQQLVVSYFGRQRVKLTKPFEAVAHGALVLNQVGEIDDYLHHSYAIRLWEPYAKTYS